MAYATVADVREVLVRDDSDTEGNAASLPDPKIEGAIEQAAAEVDGWLSGRYGSNLPFTVVPMMVKSLTVDIAAYLADLTYRQASDFSSELDPVYLRYQRAKTTLEKLADGTVSLPDVDEDGDGDPDTPPIDAAAFAVNAYTGSLFMPGDFDLCHTWDERSRYGYFGRWR
jgi:phage gp36-like protein